MKKIFKPFLMIAAVFAVGGSTLLSVKNYNYETKVTKADETVTSGTISVDLTGENWATNSGGQNISVYFWDDNNNTGWGSYEYASYQQYAVFVDYSLSFTPTYMKAVRYDNWFSKDKWQNDPWGNNQTDWTPKWGETDNLTFKENGNIVVAGSGYCFVGTAYVEGKSKNSADSEGKWQWQTLFDLSNVKLNGSKHIEYWTTHTFSQWEEFGVKIFDSFYKSGVLTCSSHVASGAFTDSSSDSNIQYLLADDGTYNIYFDRNAGTIYIDDPDYASANEYGQEFLNTMTCDGAGNITNNNWSAWSALSNSYSSLADSVKSILKNADTTAGSLEYYQQAVQRYDYIINKYGTDNYDDFMNRDEVAGIDYPSNKALSIDTIYSDEAISNNDLIILMPIAILLGLGGYMLISKKKRA